MYLVDRLKVEGFRSSPDYLFFLYIAFVLLRELHYQHYQLSLSKLLGFLRSQESSLLETKIVETEKVSNGLIRALRDD